jgi:protein-S-isoprenylcysteine O-methyltransferase Ste14
VDFQNKLSAWKLAFSAAYLALWPALIFVLAGDAAWLEGWIFSIWFLSLCVGTMLWLYVRDPALLAERYRMPGSGEQRGWDIYVFYAVLLTFVVWMVAIPLDAKRFHLSPEMPKWLEAIGGVLLAFSAFFLFRSFKDNTFLSPLVRIQSDRKHKVVSSGVYGIVRHPMYLGTVALFFGAPLLMGSCVGLAIAALEVFLLAGRIVGEENMLRSDLDGYAEYQVRVRYRLIPLVW